MYPVTDRVRAQLDKAFVYHPPKSDQTARYERIRGVAKTFAEVLATSCPDSRELSLALTKLEESVMFANAAIARNE